MPGALLAWASLFGPGLLLILAALPFWQEIQATHMSMHMCMGMGMGMGMGMCTCMCMCMCMCMCTLRYTMRNTQADLLHGIQARASTAILTMLALTMAILTRLHYPPWQCSLWL